MKWMDKFKELSGGVKLALIVPGSSLNLSIHFISLVDPLNYLTLLQLM